MIWLSIVLKKYGLYLSTCDIMMLDIYEIIYHFGSISIIYICVASILMYLASSLLVEFILYITEYQL